MPSLLATNHASTLCYRKAKLTRFHGRYTAIISLSLSHLNNGWLGHLKQLGLAEDAERRSTVMPSLNIGWHSTLDTPKPYTRCCDATSQLALSPDLEPCTQRTQHQPQAETLNPNNLAFETLGGVRSLSNSSCHALGFLSIAPCPDKYNKGPVLNRPKFHCPFEAVPAVNTWRRLCPTFTALGLGSRRAYKPMPIPVTEMTYFFRELYIETIVRNPKNVGLSGYR